MTIEQEIAQLEQQIKEKKGQLNESEPMPSEREILHATVGERIQQQAPTFQPAPTNGATPTPPAPAGDQPSYMTPELKENVQALINIAFTQNLDEAIKSAVKTNNAALLDAFHDALVDELYQELISRGKIQSVT